MPEGDASLEWRYADLCQNGDRQVNYFERQGLRYHRMCAEINSGQGGHSARSAAPHLCRQTS
eukprot:9529142-Karenia_brevis.AAC.1